MCVILPSIIYAPKKGCLYETRQKAAASLWSMQVNYVFLKLDTTGNSYNSTFWDNVQNARMERMSFQ